MTWRMRFDFKSETVIEEVLFARSFWATYEEAAAFYELLDSINYEPGGEDWMTMS